MNDIQFWELIEETRRVSDNDPQAQVAVLQERLESLAPSQIVEFDRLFHGHMARSYTSDLWAAACLINGGSSDDGFDYFRAWLIAQGRDTFERAVKNPDSLADMAEPEAELEDIMYASVNAYEAATDKEFPYPKRDRQKLICEPLDQSAECLQKKCPRLFEKFWDPESAPASDGADDGSPSEALNSLASLIGLFGGDAGSGPESLFTQAAFLMADDSPESIRKATELLQQAADQNHAGAQHLLGTCYHEGQGVPRDYRAAAEWYRRAADQDNGDACAGLGMLYQEGWGVEQDYATALKWYRKGVELQSADAASGLGVLHMDGLGVEKDTREALKWFRRAAEDGHELAANNLGIAYANGLGVKPNDAEAAKWFTVAADAGCSDAQFNLGVLYENGRGVPRDLSRAAELYRAAADQDHANAQSNLGLCYADGKGVPQDLSKSAELQKKAADQGNLVALSNLAVLYQNGRGVEKNLEEAVRLYKIVADAGVAAGQFNLGTMYERGLGVPQDLKEALRWYRLAADQNLAFAQNNIGDFYETGRGGLSQDFSLAAEWYRKAAEQGVSVAQLSLGDFHRKGQGVPQDLAEARKWYERAAAQGLDQAVERLKEMRAAGELKTAAAPGKTATPRASASTRKRSTESPAKTNTAKTPNAQAAARRALCLRTLIRRSQIEASLLALKKKKGRSNEESRALVSEARSLNDWLKDQELWSSASCQETNSLRKKPGTWTPRELKDWSWRTEAFSVIAWALGIAREIKPYDTQVNAGSILQKVPLTGSAKKFIKSAKLRPKSRILKARDIAENWLWRARTTFIQKDPKKYPPPPGWTYPKIIKTAAAHWEKEGLFETIQGDYPALGKPYSKLTQSEWETCQSIATERLYALNWLRGYADDWDHVPTGT